MYLILILIKIINYWNLSVIFKAYEKSLTILMSDRQYLSEKHCACCGIRLDKLKKRQIKQVSSPALIENINFAKPTIAKIKNHNMN